MKLIRHRLLFALVVCIGVLAACGSPASPSATAPTPASEPAPASPSSAPSATNAPNASANNVKIVWWHVSTTEPGKSFLQEKADAYMKAHPNVTIEVNAIENDAFKSKLSTAMQSGRPPDMFMSWGGGVMNEYAKAGLLQDITPTFNGDWGNTFSKASASLYSYDGKQYGAPFDLGMVGLWYNKALFKKAGITETPQTWTQFLDAVKKLKAAGITPIALGDKNKWPGHYWWVYLATRIGGQEAFTKAYTRSGAFTDLAFIEAGKKLQELVALDPFPKGYLGLDYPDAEALFGNGGAAMHMMGQWSPGNQRDMSTSKQGLGADLGFFPFPTVEGGAGNPTDAMGGGAGWVLGKNAPPEAVDFLRYFTSVDSQRELAEKNIGLPVVQGAETAVKDPALQAVVAQLGKASYFQLYYDQYLPPAVGEAVKDATQALFAGSATPEEAAKQIDLAAAEALQK